MGESARSDTLRDVFRSEPWLVCPGAELCGQRLPGDYQVVELVAEDELRFVYRGVQLVLGREVAIEVLRPEWSDAPEWRARFALEARRASRLAHPGCVDVLDLGQTFDGRPFRVLERVRGIDLASLRREHGPLSLARTVELMAQVLSVLAEAHGEGIAHGALSLECVIVRALANGQELVKVTDFGRDEAAGPRGAQADLDAVRAMIFELVTARDGRALAVALAHVRDALELHEALLAAGDQHAALGDLASDPELEFMGCPCCGSCVPLARHCCDCGRPLVLSSLTVPRGRASA